jgi:ferredoxin/coenzyme F420-reducing hydrogenase delta subunit
VPCLRFVSEALILRSFRLGAAGVALLGCADCPNGERPLMEERLSLCRATLDAFGFGAERLAAITVEASDQTYYMASAIGDLGAFLERLEPAPLLSLPAGQAAAISGGSDEPIGNRGMIADALRTFVRVTEKHPGRVVETTSLPYAHVRVQEKGCTLCAGCVFVCPTHALIMEDPGSAKTLRFNHLKCVACGMCEEACPENVVKIERGLSVDRASLSHEELVRDEMVSCISCGNEYINKQALDIILGKLFGLAQVGDTFEGQRKDLLRMCPDCRGAHAVQEVERGWEP